MGTSTRRGQAPVFDWPMPHSPPLFLFSNRGRVDARLSWLLRGSQHTALLELEVYPQRQAKQETAKEVAAQHVARPVIAQVDARWTNEDHEERGNNQQGIVPPAIPFEEDQAQRKEQAEEGDIGHHMSERTCDVLCRLLRPALFAGPDPLQKESLVALCPVDCSRALRDPRWSIAHLPGRSLGERRAGRLPLWRSLAWPGAVDIPQAQAARCAGS